MINYIRRSNSLPTLLWQSTNLTRHKILLITRSMVCILPMIHLVISLYLKVDDLPVVKVYNCLLKYEQCLNAMFMSTTLLYLCRLISHPNKPTKIETLINIISLVGMVTATLVIVLVGITIDFTKMPTRT